MPPHEIWPFSPRAFFSDTKGMSAVPSLAYLKLLASYWVNRGLPDDESELARIADLDARTWRRHRARLAKFFYNVGKPGGWKQKRMERDLAQAAAFTASQRRAANRRWHASQPVDNGETRLQQSCGQTCSTRANVFNGITHASAYAVAMPLSKITNSPFGTRKRSADVDNLKNLAQTSKVAYDGNPPPNDSPNPAYQRAQQRLLRTLLTDLGERAFADLIETFASNADLLHRATIAEQRKPNSGAAFIVNALQWVR